MTMTASPVVGRPLWYELMTSDMKAADTFYKNVVGWTSAPFEGSPMPYTMFKRSSDRAGGWTDDAATRDEGAAVLGDVHRHVGKIEDAAAQIKKLGGGELSPIMKIFTVGRMQMVKDPQGAAFSIYQPATTEFPPEGPAQDGEASWHELMTTDAPAAMKFYSELFGWQPSETMDMGPMGKLSTRVNRPHGMIGGMMNKPPEMAQVPPHWAIYFHVPAMDAAIERVTATGGEEFLNGPMEVPGGTWVANAMDPQGAAFSLHAPKR